LPGSYKNGITTNYEKSLIKTKFWRGTDADEKIQILFFIENVVTNYCTLLDAFKSKSAIRSRMHF